MLTLCYCSEPGCDIQVLIDSVTQADVTVGGDVVEFQ